MKTNLYRSFHTIEFIERLINQRFQLQSGFNALPGTQLGLRRNKYFVFSLYRLQLFFENVKVIIVSFLCRACGFSSQSMIIQCVNCWFKIPFFKYLSTNFTLANQPENVCFIYIPPNSKLRQFELFIS